MGFFKGSNLFGSRGEPKVPPWGVYLGMWAVTDAHLLSCSGFQFVQGDYSRSWKDQHSPVLQVVAALLEFKIVIPFWIQELDGYGHIWQQTEFNGHHPRLPAHPPLVPTDALLAARNRRLLGIASPVF
jgi:hypothetical protein